MGIIVNPNYATGVVRIGHSGFGLGTNVESFPRPSAATWHHIVITLDSTAADTDEVVAAWVDGSGQTLTPIANNDGGGTAFPNTTWSFMARNAASLFGAGRIAEIGIWGALNFSQTDVDNLYAAGAGTAASNVQGGSLIHYWQVCGTDSPETATVGGINLTVAGAVNVTHPISGVGICGAVAGGSGRLLLMGVGP
jgi:hypothetical protein